MSGRTHSEREMARQGERESGGGGAEQAERRGGGGGLLYEAPVRVLVRALFPRPAPLYVAAVLKLLVINGPVGPKLILYSHKALMQGKVGANGTLARRGQSRGGSGADAATTQK